MKRSARRVLCAFTWCAVFLVGIEILLEYRSTRRGFDTIVWGAGKSDPDESTIFDSQRVFGPSPDFPYRSRIPRKSYDLTIWLASASYAVDVRIPVEMIFPVLLENQLRASGTDAIVINASQSGRLIDWNSKSLESDVANSLRPQIAVLYQMGTDLKRLTATQKNVPTFSLSPLPIIPQAANALKNITRESTVYSHLRMEIAARITSWKPLNWNLPDRADAAYLAEIIGFVESARRQGTIPLICSFSVPYDDSNVGKMSTDTKLSALRFNPTLAAGGWHKCCETLNLFVAEYCRVHDIRFVDVASEMSGRPEYFRDMVHFNKVGHQKLATILAREIATIEVPD